MTKLRDPSMRARFRWWLQDHEVLTLAVYYLVATSVLFWLTLRYPVIGALFAAFGGLAMIWAKIVAKRGRL